MTRSQTQLLRQFACLYSCVLVPLNIQDCDDKGSENPASSISKSSTHKPITSMADHIDDPEVTNNDLDGSLGARIQSDPTITHGTPPAIFKSHWWTLPDDIASSMQPPEVASERSLLLLCALRILHYRYSEDETAPIALHDSHGFSLTRLLSIHLNGNMTVEQAVDLSRASLDVARSSTSYPDQDIPSSNLTCFRYSEDSEYSVPRDG